MDTLKDIHANPLKFMLYFTGMVWYNAIAVVEGWSLCDERNTSVVCVAAILLMASVGSAAMVWSPASNGITPPAVGNYGDAANWSGGAVPTLTGPDKVVFNAHDAAESQITDARRPSA